MDERPFAGREKKCERVIDTKTAPALGACKYDVIGTRAVRPSKVRYEWKPKCVFISTLTTAMKALYFPL